MKKVWKKFTRWVRNTWSRRDQLAEDAREIVEALIWVRNALDSNTAKAITEMIPGDVDERIRVALVTALSRLDAIRFASDPALGYVKTTPMKDALVHKTASLAIQQLHPDISDSKADTVAQLTYNALKTDQRFISFN